MKDTLVCGWKGTSGFAKALPDLRTAMKYELEPDNRNCPDNVLLDDLRSTAQQLGKLSLTQAEYSINGRFSSATLKKRFGSWNRALELCGLHVKKRNDIPKEELLADLRRVAAIVGEGNLSGETYNQLGNFSDATFTRTFGSWINALTAINAKVSDSWKPRTSDDDLFSNMADVWEKVGRQPKQRDFHPPVSRISESACLRRFGSWRKALEAFVAAANGEISQQISQKIDKLSTLPPMIEQEKRRTAREPGWRLRFLVNRRDRFTCRACGRSPALEPGVVLDVDHIVPWSKGGETTFDNLQTLCKRCNIGKSDLSMKQDAEGIR
jgi:hypothetical protein